MGKPIAAIQVKIGYLAQAKSSKPANVTWTGNNAFTAIPDLKSTPDFNVQPNTADASTFDNAEYTTSVELLKDLGGSLAFNANFTAALAEAWKTAVSSAASNADGGVWWGIDIPGYDKSIIFFGKPSKLGLPSLTANTLAETSVYITPITEPEWVPVET